MKYLIPRDIPCLIYFDRDKYSISTKIQLSTILDHMFIFIHHTMPGWRWFYIDHFNKVMVQQKDIIAIIEEKK